MRRAQNVYSIVAPGTDWVDVKGEGSGAEGTAPQFTTVDTPVGAADTALCGKAAFSDLHVSSGGSGDKNNGNAWPGECANPVGDLTAQEKALEFLFFDLSACVQNDSVAHRHRRAESFSQRRKPDLRSHRHKPSNAQASRCRDK